MKIDHCDSICLQIIIPGLERVPATWIYDASLEIEDDYLYIKDKQDKFYIYNMRNIRQITVR